MELAMKYVYEVYCEKSFSAAAKKLFISQPSVSATVSKLEAELGFQIFDRSTVPLSLTPAGEIYIDTVTEIMEAEWKMKERLGNLSEQGRGTCTVGSSTFYGNFLLPRICREMKRQYPGIHVTLDMGNIGGRTYLTDMLNTQRMDFILHYQYDPKLSEALPVSSERFVIAMHRDLCRSPELKALAVSREELVGSEAGDRREITDFSLFHDIPFLPKHHTVSFGDIEKYFGEVNPANYRVLNSRTLNMHYDMMCAGLGAVVISDYVVKYMPADDELLYFLPGGMPCRHLYLVWKKGVRLSDAARKFRDVTLACAKEYS